MIGSIDVGNRAGHTQSTTNLLGISLLGVNGVCL